MDNSDWWDFVVTTLGSDSQHVAANRVGIDKSNFSRWKRGSRPDVDFVVKFARAYQVNVLEALVAAGFITRDEADTREVRVGVQDALQTASLDDLLDEVRRRAR